MIASINIHYIHPPNLNPSIAFTKIRRSNIDFRRALAFTLLAFAFNCGRLRTFLLAPASNSEQFRFKVVKTDLGSPAV